MAMNARNLPSPKKIHQQVRRRDVVELSAQAGNARADEVDHPQGREYRPQHIGCKGDTVRMVEPHGTGNREGRVKPTGDTEVEHHESESGRDLEVIVHGHPAALCPAAGAHPENEHRIESDDDDCVVPGFHCYSPRDASASLSIFRPQ